MNRKGFMAELRNLLVFMDAGDRARVLRRYETMFDEAGEDEEQTLIRCFGSPVRQVLLIEQEYREAQAKGEVPFADAEKDLPNPMPAYTAPEEPEEEPAPEEPGPEDREEAAEAETEAAIPEPERETPAAEEAAVEELPETSGQDALTSEPLDLSDPELPAEKTIVPVAETAMPWEEEKEIRPRPEPPRPEPPRPEPQPEVSEEDEDEEDYDDDEDDEEGEYRPGAGRIIGAVLVTIPMLAVWAVCFAFFLALGVTVLGVGIACGAAALYLMSYVFSGVITLAPDLMLVGGGALVVAAAALLLIWMGLWIAVGGCLQVGRMTAGIYRGVLGKKREE